MGKGKTIQAYSIINQSVLRAGLYYVEQRETKGFTFLAHRSTNIPNTKQMLAWLFQIHPWVLHESTAMPFWCYSKNANSFTAQKAWKALHFVMHVLKKKGNRNTKPLAYTSVVRPILEYGSVRWDPCRGQIKALDRVQKKADQFTNHTKDSDGKLWLSVGRLHAYAHLLTL